MSETSRITLVWESGNTLDLSLVHDYELYANGICRVYMSCGVAVYGCEEYPIKEVLIRH